MVALACMQLFSYHTARSHDGQMLALSPCPLIGQMSAILASDWPVCPVEAVLSNPGPVQRRPGPGDGQTRCKWELNGTGLHPAHWMKDTKNCIILCVLTECFIVSRSASSSSCVCPKVSMSSLASVCLRSSGWWPHNASVTITYSWLTDTQESRGEMRR